MRTTANTVVVNCSFQISPYSRPCCMFSFSWFRPKKKCAGHLDCIDNFFFGFCFQLCPFEFHDISFRLVLRCAWDLDEALLSMFILKSPMSPMHGSRKASRFSCSRSDGSISWFYFQSVIFHVEYHPAFPWFTQCVTFNFFPTPAHELAYNLFNLITVYGLPLVVIIVSYSLIVWEMNQKTRQSKGENRLRNVYSGACVIPIGLTQNPCGPKNHLDITCVTLSVLSVDKPSSQTEQRSVLYFWAVLLQASRKRLFSKSHCRVCLFLDRTKPGTKTESTWDLCRVAMFTEGLNQFHVVPLETPVSSLFPISTYPTVAPAQFRSVFPASFSSNCAATFLPGWRHLGILYERRVALNWPFTDTTVALHWQDTLICFLPARIHCNSKPKEDSSKTRGWGKKEI